MGDKNSKLEKNVDLIWKDTPIGGIKVVRQHFKLIFKEVLPELGRNALDYHIKYYLNNHTAYDKKETIEEEKQRFKSYLMITYQKY